GVRRTAPAAALPAADTRVRPAARVRADSLAAADVPVAAAVPDVRAAAVPREHAAAASDRAGRAAVRPGRAAAVGNWRSRSHARPRAGEASNPRGNVPHRGVVSYRRSHQGGPPMRFWIASAASVCALTVSVSLPPAARAQAAAPEAASAIRTYKTVDGVELKAHVFAPVTADAGPRPAIVFFHGGGWNAGSPEWAYERARRYAAKGLTAIAIQYRLSDF